MSSEHAPVVASRKTSFRATAAGIAGVMEIGLFHPFDTVAKRLMSHHGPILCRPISASFCTVNEIIFRAKAHASAWEKLLYLYPGSTYAVGYKVLQRVYKLAGQPIVRDHLKCHYDRGFDNVFGRHSRLAMEAVAGSIVGGGEVLLLPLDRLKVLSQTNESALGRGVVELVRREGVRGMYAGTLVTAMRNVPGTFCLFGGAAFTKESIFRLEDFSKASFFQNMCASGVGACLAIAVTNPMDVIKTRVQNKDPGSTLTGLVVFRKLLREEGLTALAKGITPKIIASAPKLVFAYSMTEFLLQLLEGEKRGVVRH
ncbi:mitochondrial carrier protein [Trypanosoma equiperdum]|uniref:Mitochondrial carrier protein, putative n=3 Tax=Trypanozoon TaxID=39700 RepID=Q587G5_TRYB2|nr:mitochondrial carrier protein, putative [Trypanosoma brucei brucei TREU927]AAQ15754.1 mitochondrial carrier protein, putative [Trypanosoma brucei brucei TREU927]AAX78899.1 mitochondrial carrier protein, putative [Trypanosoma brucei]SCU64798.1 mitochondrial carrier protein [Trypanosoma equiperdum]